MGGDRSHVPSPCSPGSLIHGPWDYRIASFIFVTPVYTVILLCVATLFGQQAYFITVAKRMWGRLIPALRDAPKKTS